MENPHHGYIGIDRTYHGLYRGLTVSEFQTDQKIIDSVLRNLEIIGEAARHIPQNMMKKYSDIPWNEMRAMRNIVIHEYFGVNLSIIWHTTQVNLPSIVNRLKEILENE